jgi:membrane dipeptidase
MINVSSQFLDQEVANAGRADVMKVRTEYEQLKRQFSNDPKRRDAAIEGLFEKLPAHRTFWTKVVDHIEHVIRIAGPDAVGIGTDFDGITDPPEGLEDVSKLPKITEELLHRGYSEDLVRKVLGENFLSFFKRVEQASRSLSSEPPSTASIQE